MENEDSSSCSEEIEDDKKMDLSVPRIRPTTSNRKKWTQDELKRLKKNIKHYCKKNKISDFNEFIKDNSREVIDFRRRTGYAQSLKKGIDCNSIDALLKARRYFCKYERNGKWSHEEIYKLMALYNLHGPKWTIIGKELNRSDRSCNAKFGNMTAEQRQMYSNGTLNMENAPQRGRRPWTIKEHDLLVESVKAWISKHPDTPICWKNISEKLKTRTATACYDRWHSCAIFSEVANQDISKLSKNDLEFMPAELFIIRKFIIDGKFNHYNKINYTELLKLLPRFQSDALLKSAMRYNLRSRVKSKRLSLQEFIETIN